MNTWKNMLVDAFNQTGDNYAAMVSTLTPDELNTQFDDSFGHPEGKQFTVWGEKYVYFPVVYDGAESVGFAPRNPCDIATPHVGGY